MRVQSLGPEDPLEKINGSPLSIPSWELPWTGDRSKITENHKQVDCIKIKQGTVYLGRTLGGISEDRGAW